MQRRDGGAVAHRHARRAGALRQRAFEVLAAQVDVLVAERVAEAGDRHVQEGLAGGADEFERVDRIAEIVQALEQAHALRDVPAAAEEVHHVAFAAQCRLALDHQRIEAVPLELDGEGEAGDAAAGDEDAVHGCHPGL
jgi:hypothetical protein